MNISKSFPNETAFPGADFRKQFREALVARSPHCSVMRVGRSLLGEDIELYHLGRGARRVFYAGAHHGAEGLTANIMYAFLRALAEREARGGRLFGKDVRFLLKKYSFFVIPLVNPDGVAMSAGEAKESILTRRQLKMNGGADFRGWSANARGVDLNHNYDAGFYEYKKIEWQSAVAPGRGKYSGEFPESEPESRAVAAAVRAIAPMLVLSLHSQGREVFYSPRNKRTERLAARAARLVGYEPKTPSGTAAYGGLSDYTGARLGIPSLTVEMGKGENPLPEREYFAHRDRLINMLALLPTLV